MKKEPRILVNKIITPDGTELISHHRHDYRSYVDESRLSFSVDGGSSYLRRSVGFDPIFSLFTDKEERLIKEKEITYNPMSGRFTDAKSNYRDTTIGADGYRTISIGGKTYKAHRLIFLLSGQNISEKEVDHIDNIRSNNTWINLRIVSKKQSQANALLRTDSSTKIKGLTFHKSKKLWVGRVQHNKKRYEVSSKTKEIAIEKLEKLRIRVHGIYANSGHSSVTFTDFYTEASLYSTSPFEEIRKGLHRGDRGIDGTESLSYVLLKDMSNEWLKNVIIYEKDFRPNNIYMEYYLKEIEYRIKNNIYIK